ncbi:peptidoglycan DD-metalloendopeptidase family protein [Thauera aromatica]|uniref:murein hydrolase activator EnvC family protein n=1 Tax=Thauera aromatica TaxID=59405 RepID=UPI001FFD7887|nr:peptidoglycan DD-metalloendopeptidase family protein [Thauera aromatica]MCK2089505.1 peptidoglycan DD-metalloendopeptidase family protein [Thauera aromatica]
MLDRWRRGILVFGLVLVGAGSALPASAQEGGEIAERRQGLNELKKRIDDLQQDMARTESRRSSAAVAVAEAERAVSRVTRQLLALETERKDAEQRLVRLEAAQRDSEARIDARQDELAQWLRRYYVHGAADGVAPLLSARDPNQLARDAHYLEHLGRARLAVIESLRADLTGLERQREELRSHRDRMLALAGEQRARRAELESVQLERTQALAAIADELQAQKRQVGTLRQDEQRLAKVIDALVQRAREAAARDAARQLAARRAAEQRAAGERAGQARAPVGSAPPARRGEAVVGEARSAAGPTPTGVRFSQLRGQLRFPVRGELVGRFGAPRAEGGTTWKGVFIRAATGTDVRAVAGGEIVFSDWLRGYGNLIIIDHGGDYLSIYGNNDALLGEVGEEVGGGDTIARVGSEGGGGESGLYFEIRHQGQPQDPMKWVRLD